MQDILSFKQDTEMSEFSFSFGCASEFNATLSRRSGTIPYKITEADKEGQDRAAAIRCGAAKLLTTEEPITIDPVTFEANPGISAEGDESPALLSPFSNDELAVVQSDYKKLHVLYRTAVMANFHNAQGKEFVRGLLAFLLPQEVYCCEISTSPNGEEQPGALTVEWVTHKTEESNDAQKTQRRCADVIAYNMKKKHHTIVVEIKCNERDAKPQLLEQMCGLFDPQQKFMLGLLVYPLDIAPLIMVRVENTLKVFKLNYIHIREGEGVEKLAALILSTSREVSEQ